VDSRLWFQWQVVIQIATGLQFDNEDDAMIWKFNSSVRFSVHSLYAIVNDRGVRQIYTPVVWRFSVPPKLHIFLWLLSNNKTLTGDNLAKRREVDDKTCLFCEEIETVHHLFFDCCVAKLTWQMCADLSGKQLGADFESVAKFWLHDKKLKSLNVLTTTVFWTIWKFRNELCFQGRRWTGMKVLMGRWARTLRDWMILQQPEEAVVLENWLMKLERGLSRPVALPWAQTASTPRDAGPDDWGCC
jgi:hypothetical protein